MIDLPYSLVIEATEEPDFFGFFSPTLQGFTGTGHSVEDCIYQARHGMADHLATMNELKLPIPDAETEPTILIQNQSRVAA